MKLQNTAFISYPASCLCVLLTSHANPKWNECFPTNSTVYTVRGKKWIVNKLIHSLYVLALKCGQKRTCTHIQTHTCSGRAITLSTSAVRRAGSQPCHCLSATLSYKSATQLPGTRRGVDGWTLSVCTDGGRACACKNLFIIETI